MSSSQTELLIWLASIKAKVKQHKEIDHMDHNIKKSGQNPENTVNLKFLYSLPCLTIFNPFTACAMKKKDEILDNKWIYCYSEIENFQGNKDGTKMTCCRD